MGPSRRWESCGGTALHYALRELGATKLLDKSPMWPTLGPPQGVWADIWPIGEPPVHEPIYKRGTD